MGGELDPTLEVGVRHDGGDAKTGFGLDADGGLAWSYPGYGVQLQLSGRGRGPMLNLPRNLGDSSPGGASVLLGRCTLAGFAANDDRDPLEWRRFEARFGNRFTSMPELGFGVSNVLRRHSLGWRLNLACGESPALELALEEDRREAVSSKGAGEPRTEPERTAGFRMTARW